MKPPSFEHTYAQLPAQFFERVTPDKAPNPNLVALNPSLAHEMGLDANWLSSNAGLAMMSGGKMPEGTDPIAMVYGGHQFGHWSGRLGDGRACLLGEIVGPDEVQRDLVLKGSGPTPFSRRGDGKSELGPVLREYIVSEAMAAYGVPTTRALAALTTGENVLRGETLPGGILVRVAKSHVRVGTFQYFYAQNDLDGLRALADYVIARHYPQAAKTSNPYVSLLSDVMKAQASLVAKWMGLGFIHGVMNTDNMQIAGETLDYGPCAFMDNFHPQKTFSSIDHKRRYAWGQQPHMALWNLTQLAQSLSPLLGTDENKTAKLAQGVLGEFNVLFQAEFTQIFADKLGMSTQADGFGDFLTQTFKMMAEQEIDFTLFFRKLTQVAGGADDVGFKYLFQEASSYGTWLKLWRKNTALNGNKIAGMQKINPIYIPRNHRIEQIIQAAREGNTAPFDLFNKVLKTPYTAQKGQEEFENPPGPDEIVTQTFCGT